MASDDEFAFRRKAKTVEAFHWQGKSDLPMPDWLYVAVQNGRARNQGGVLVVKLEGGREIAAQLGQWILRDMARAVTVMDDAAFEGEFEKDERRPKVRSWRDSRSKS